MQKIKLIALDIDGTLIAGFGEPISARDKDAIRRAQEAGVAVTLATGRILDTALKWLNQLHIDVPVIICNGADIRDRRKSWYQDSLTIPQARVIMNAYAGTGQKRYIFSDNVIYCTGEDYFQPLFDKWEQGEEKHFPVRTFAADDEMYAALPGHAEKVLVWAPSDEMAPALHEVAQTLADRYTVARGEARNVEFNKLGVSKGSGLARLAELMGFSVGEVMAIGDGGNDAEMLRTAGVGVAMANAMHEAKEAADYLTGDVRDGGVAQAIDRFVFGIA